MTSTRNFGRQSSSVATTMARGLRSVTSRASMSRKPRTAFTGWPSGALKALAGMPKKARNIRLDPSSRSQSAAIVPSSGPGGDGSRRPDDRLELGAQRQDAVLVARPADELDADREPGLRGRQRKTDGRLPSAVERVREAQPVEEIAGCGVDVLAQRTDRRRRIRQGRGEQHVDLVPGCDQASRLLG